MGSLKATASSALAFMATLFLLSSTALATSPFCGNVSDPVLCEQMSKGSDKWDIAMTNALSCAKNRFEGDKKVVSDIHMSLPPNMKPVTKDSIDKTCKESYDRIMYNMDSCIGFVKNDPDGSMRTYLSASTFSDCTDTLTESGIVVQPANQFKDEVNKLCDVLYAVALKKPN